MSTSVCALQKPLELLKQAIDQEDVKVLQKILSEQIKDSRDLNQEVDDESNTLLHIAAQKNFLEGVIALINNGAHPKVTNKAFKTPAALATDKKVIEELKKAMDTATRLWENREGLPKRVLYKYQQIWNSPIGDDTMKAAEEALKRLKSSPRPALSPEALLRERRNTSNTMNSETVGRQATANWSAADKKITELAAKKDQKPSLKTIQDIHLIIAYNLPIEHPGEFRKLGNNVDRSNGQPYIFGDHVQKEMEELETWLWTHLDLCDKDLYNPLVLAAKTFQRFLAIHPFKDGNGRVARLLVDYILQRYNLPVAVITSNIELTEIPPEEAVRHMLNIIQPLQPAAPRCKAKSKRQSKGGTEPNKKAAICAIREDRFGKVAASHLPPV